jgi:hypothetical protein
MSFVSRAAAGAAVAAVAVTGGLSLLAMPASASTIDGTATLTNPATNTPITSAGGSSNFTLTLPPQAACTGDTATGGYHVYSYVIAGPLSASALTTYLQGLNPNTGVGSTYFPITDNGGNFYGPANTAIGTGQITQIPLNLNFGVLNGLLSQFSLPTLPGTTQEVGILCATSSNVVTDFWNTEVTFTASSDSSGFSFAPTSPGSQTPEVPLAVVLPLAGLGLLGGGVFFARRRNAQAATASI